MTREAYASSERAAKYVRERRRPWRRLAKAWEVGRIRRLAGPPTTRGRVLDVACGGGRFDCHVACDRSAGMAAIAKAAGRRTVRGDAFALPFRDDAFDTTLCVRLLHRFDEQQRRAALVELARVGRRAVVSYFATTGVKGRRRAARDARAAERSTTARPAAQSRSRTRRGIPPATFAGDCAAAGWTVLRDVASIPGWSEQRIALLERA